MSDYNDGLLPEPCLRMDTHFGDEYESVEFGDGTGYVKAASMLARLGALHVELDELRDENARLRSFLSDDAENARLIMGENAKLREDLEFERSENGWAREFLNRMGQKCGTKDCPSLVAYVTKLEAENAKLLELVRFIMHQCNDGNPRCNECISWNDGECVALLRMRELGVEVDE